jgi:hypothetical protein
MKNKDDLLLEILQGPVNANSNSSVINKTKKEEKENEEVDELKFNFGPVKETEEKYQERIKKQAQEDPESVYLDTPMGEMTLAEAIRMGYNPETGEFEDDLKPPSLEDEEMDPELMQKLMMLMQMPQEEGAMPPGMGKEMPMTEEEMMMQEQMAMTEGEGIDEELMALEQGGVM